MKKFAMVAVIGALLSAIAGPAFAGGFDIGNGRSAVSGGDVIVDGLQVSGSDGGGQGGDG